MFTQREAQFDADEDGHWLAQSRARNESPLSGGLDRFLIEPECRIERLENLHIRHVAVGVDDALDQDGALDLRTHRVRGVIRFHLAQQPRHGDAVTGPIRAAARSTAAPRSEAGATTNTTKSAWERNDASAAGAMRFAGRSN